MQTEGKNGTPARVRPRYVGNLVLRVESYNGEATSANCYTGFITGRVEGGPLAGKSIPVWIRETSTNSRVPTVSDLQDETGMVRTPEGGYLALEGVRQEGGRFTARWVNRMGGPEAELRAGLPVQISPSLASDGSVRRFRSNGATYYNGFVMHVRNVVQATQVEAMRKLATEAIEARGAAALAVILNSPEGTSRKTMSVLRYWKDGNRIPAGEAVEGFLQRHPEARFRQLFEAGAVVDVIPMEIFPVSSRTAESMDLGGRNAVPLTDYMTGGLGTRIGGVLRRLEPAESSRFESAFLAQAHPNARSAFASVGWKGVWSSDIERYFKSMNIPLPRIGKFGFAVSTLALKPFGPEADSGKFIARARGLSSAVPRDAVPTPSDPDAISRYYESIRNAVTSSLDMDHAGPKSGPARRLGLESPGRNADIELNGSHNAGKPDGVFNVIGDQVEPDSGRQMDF